jgi:hypothetical protein
MAGTNDESASGRPQGLYGNTTALTSPRCFQGQDPSINRVSRFELLNDVAGRELRVYRKSPPPPRGRTSINAFGLSVALKATMATRSPRCFEEDERLSANPSIARVSRFELPNNVTGRELKVYRKSPSPPTIRGSSPAQDSE